MSGKSTKCLNVIKVQGPPGPPGASTAQTCIYNRNEITALLFDITPPPPSPIPDQQAIALNEAVLSVSDVVDDNLAKSVCLDFSFDFIPQTADTEQTSYRALFRFNPILSTYLTCDDYEFPPVVSVVSAQINASREGDVCLTSTLRHIELLLFELCISSPEPLLTNMISVDVSLKLLDRPFFGPTPVPVVNFAVYGKVENVGDSETIVLAALDPYLEIVSLPTVKEDGTPNVPADATASNIPRFPGFVFSICSDQGQFGPEFNGYFQPPSTYDRFEFKWIGSGSAGNTGVGMLNANGDTLQESMPGQGAAAGGGGAGGPIVSSSSPIPFRNSLWFKVPLPVPDTGPFSKNNTNGEICLWTDLGILEIFGGPGNTRSGEGTVDNNTACGGFGGRNGPDPAPPLVGILQNRSGGGGAAIAPTSGSAKGGSASQIDDSNATPGTIVDGATAGGGGNGSSGANNINESTYTYPVECGLPTTDFAPSLNPIPGGYGGYGWNPCVFPDDGISSMVPGTKDFSYFGAGGSGGVDTCGRGGMGAARITFLPASP